MVQPKDFHKFEALSAGQIIRMIVILYGEKLANELAHELVYNKDKYADRTVVWPRY